MDSLKIEPLAVKESLINEAQNNFDTPFDYRAGSVLLRRFSKFTPIKEHQISLALSGTFINNGEDYKAQFALVVGGERWTGYASNYFITPCCCGGGPRWVYEFRIYDTAGYLRWKYSYDDVGGRVNYFYNWDLKIPQLERVVVLKDIDFRGEGGTFPGLMEVWE